MHGGTGGDVFFASTGTDYIEDFKFTEDKLENSVSVTWDIENATYDDENESVIINTLGSTEEGSGTTTIKVTNYAELIAAKEEENDIAGFPIVGGDSDGSGGDGSGVTVTALAVTPMKAIRKTGFRMLQVQSTTAITAQPIKTTMLKMEPLTANRLIHPKTPQTQPINYGKSSLTHHPTNHCSPW